MCRSILMDGTTLPTRWRGCCCPGARPRRRTSRESILRARPDRRRWSRWQRAPKSRTPTIWHRTAGSWASRRAAIRTLWFACLFQGGEHGRLAARLATQVIKAYVDKQQRTPQKMVEKPKGNGTVDVGGLWSVPGADGDKDALQGGRFLLDLPKKGLVLATAAPGMN